MTHETPNSWAKFPNSNGSADARYADDSERFADWAVSTIVHAGRFPEDSRAHAIAVRTAQVYATLSLRDKLDELVTVLRDTRDVHDKARAA